MSAASSTRSASSKVPCASASRRYSKRFCLVSSSVIIIPPPAFMIAGGVVRGNPEEPRQCDPRSGGRLHRRFRFAGEEAALVEGGVERRGLEQFLVAALGGDAAVQDHADLV